jgi:hypothetical protein
MFRAAPPLYFAAGQRGEAVSDLLVGHDADAREHVAVAGKVDG